MEKREWIIWVVLGLLMISTVYLWTHMPAAPSGESVIRKTGYVEVVEVFEAFEMKQELQQKLENDLNAKQAVLDSLMFQLQTLNNALSAKEHPGNEEIQAFQGLQTYYLQQKQLFDGYSQELTAKYDAQILEQLSQYIKDFGLANGYDYVFGATGDGNILYGTEPANITPQVIEYINASYQGKL